jgi:putative Holliday junction resolvase
MPDDVLPRGKRILAIDLGEKRIGVAISDETHLIARSYEVINRGARTEDFARFATIVADEDVGYLVFGLPVHLSGDEGDMAAWVRDYAASLASHLGLPYALWDESFTTQQASASMRARGKRARNQRDWIDAVAAAFILQSFLDGHRE